MLQIWVEDSGAGYKFIKTLSKHYLNKVNVVNHDGNRHILFNLYASVNSRDDIVILVGSKDIGKL